MTGRRRSARPEAEPLADYRGGAACLKGSTATPKLVKPSHKSPKSLRPATGRREDVFAEPRTSATSSAAQEVAQWCEYS